MISATVIKANAPRLLKDAVARTTYVSIAINIQTGYINVCETHSLTEAEEEFKNRGDPPEWRGLQIIRVDADHAV